MWWFDKKAVARGEKLRDFYKIDLMIETGTFKGLNLKFWSYRFPYVIGIEKDAAYCQLTRERIATRNNATLYHESSPQYLSSITRMNRGKSPVLFYLDAHFYDPAVLPEKRWVVRDELKALNNFHNCVIVIHDFDCHGLGHLVYDGQPLNLDLIREDLMGVNPDFHLYGNTRDGCEAHTVESITGVEGLEPDEETIETINYHNTDRLKYRGILYATPTPLDLTKFDLVEIG